MYHFAGRNLGRFARARGNSLFARSFNKELPRGLVGALRFAAGSGSIRMFGENPLCGFAEQFKTLGTAGFNQLNGTSEESQSMALGVLTQEEALQLAALTAGDISFYLSQWSGLSRECVLSEIYSKKHI